MGLGIPIVQGHYKTTAERSWPIKTRRFFVRRVTEKLLPPFLGVKAIRVHVGVGGLVPDQFHEPLRRFPLDFEHHGPFQRAQPVVHQKKRNENRWDSYRDEPFVADVAGWMKYQSFPGQLVVKLLD